MVLPTCNPSSQEVEAGNQKMTVILATQFIQGLPAVLWWVRGCGITHIVYVNTNPQHSGALWELGEDSSRVFRKKILIEGREREYHKQVFSLSWVEELCQSIS